MARSLSYEEEQNVNLDNAVHVGDGPVTKGSFYRVFRTEDNTLYATVMDTLNYEICLIEEIEESEIESYCVIGETDA